MMWLGTSPSNWAIYSPRSVSTTASPTFSRSALRCSSSVTIDFDLMIDLTPFISAISRTMRRASSASGAQWTIPPAFSTFSTSISR